MRVQQGEALLWQRHLERLNHTCHFLGLTPPDPAPHLEHMRERINTLERDFLYRLTVTPEGSFGTVRPAPPILLPSVAVWLSSLEVHPQLGLHKTGNYLPYLLALREAKANDCFEGLLSLGFHLGSHWVDGSRAAFLLDLDGVLVSPKGGLPSVTRAHVLQDLPHLERWVGLEDLARAQHAWLLGSGVGVLPIHTFRGEGVSLELEVRELNPRAL